MPAFVFLSHSSKDDATVTRIHDQIEDITKQDVWVDHRDLTTPGTEWQPAIDAALGKLTHMLVILSRHSVTSPEVTAEWRDALLRKKPLLPVIIDDLPLESIPSRLRIITAVDLHKNWDGGIQLLADAITRAESGTATPDDFARWPVTGLMDRRLVSIPISGREADLTAVRGLLAQLPTLILGVGGLGKSRLAAELVLTQEAISGAVWHVCDEFSTAENVLELLRDHLGLDPATERRDLLKRLRAEHLLVVLDNAESVDDDPDRRKDYVKLVDELHAANQQVLLTSRSAWPDFKPGRVKLHQLEHPAAPACRQIVLDMAGQFGITGYDMNPHADALAQAARYHPRLIEWGVGKLTLFAPDKVIRELTDLKSRDVQDALDEMITQTVRQMIEAHGPDAAAALRRLAVCRGGFTYHAAGYLLQHETLGMTAEDYVAETAPAVPTTLNTDTLDALLHTLARWQFVRPTVANDHTRYTLDPLVIAAVGEDAATHQSHYDYYHALAWQHDERQDYLGIDPESANLEAAYEWALAAGDGEDALWLANACGIFLQNRGRFEQGLTWFERVAEKLSQHPDEQLRANSQNSLANIYQEHPLGDRHDNLKRALLAYEAALVHFTPQAAPLAYAATQNNLGLAYADLAQIGEREANLNKAVAAYQAALQHYTPQAAPLAYAMTQNNLGIAYRDLAQLGEREANLHKAVAAYEAALVHFTAQAAPLDYAMTQNNLGIAYRALAQIGEREANLSKALAAYEAALEHYTAQAAPLDYAMTQNNLGVAYSDLAQIGEREANLHKAVAAYEAALVYRTAQAAPLDYAQTQWNYGNAQRDLDDLPGAIARWREAETCYRLMGVTDQADLMLRWIADAGG
ncbi:MAG: toll/interleukin-1 receptor domain-containing protein [Anaerolineae bacterium]